MNDKSICSRTSRSSKLEKNSQNKIELLTQIKQYLISAKYIFTLFIK